MPTTASVPAAPQQRVIAMSGLVASGKSTVAKALAQHIDAALIVADEVRNTLLGVTPLERTEIAILTKNYSSELPKKVYAEVLRHTQKMLAAGHTVIVDACFSTRANRDALRELAVAFQAPLLFIECRAPEAVIDARLAARSTRDGVEPSAWHEIATRLKADWEAIDEVAPHEYAVADTSCPVDEIVSKLCHHFAMTSRESGRHRHG